MILRLLLLTALSVQFFESCSTAGTKSIDAQVIIVGGNGAAMYSADGLLEAGIDDFIILEETDNVKGYFYPLEFGGKSFVPGAMFAENPFVKPLMESLGVGIVLVSPESYTVYDSSGQDVTAEAKERESAFMAARREGLDQVADDMDSLRRPDLPYKATLARGGWVASSDIDKVMEWYNFDYYEGCPSQDISTVWSYRQAEKNLFPERCFVTGAARAIDDNIVEHIGEERIRYNSRPKRVNRTPDYVCVTVEDGTEYCGNYGIIPSSVGLINNGDITFDPPLPSWKAEEFARYKMCTLDVIFMKFPTKFWDDTEYILHANNRHGYYPLFMNTEAEGLFEAGTNILLGFVSGDEALRVESLSDDKVQAEVLEVLKTMYGGGNVPDPTEFHVSRFATDPDIGQHGSFTTYPIGALPEDTQDRLRAPVGRLYFAPEDAAEEHIGNPLGNFLDGSFAAGGVAASINGTVAEEYYPGPDLSICRQMSTDDSDNAGGGAGGIVAQPIIMMIGVICLLGLI